MFTTYRRHDRLIVYTGVGHDDAHGVTRLDKAALDIRHRLGLPQWIVVIQINATRVCDHWYCDTSLSLWQSSESLDQFNTGHTDGFRISHHMCLTHFHHIRSVEHTPYLHLMLKRPASSRPHFTGEHGLSL